jgi:tetratricopeptide (TPR) repeat protein
MLLPAKLVESFSIGDVMAEIGLHESIEQIDALIARRRTLAARNLLSTALKQYPDDTALLLQAAWVDYLEDKSESAAATAKSILAREPDNTGAKQLLMELYIEQGDLVEAERLVLELLRAMPEHAHYYGRYADIMLRALNVDKAAALATEGLRYSPDDRECLAAHTVCDFIQHGRGEPSPALRKLLVEHPQSIRTLYLVVVALEQRGKNRQAYEIAKEMLRAQPDNNSLVGLVQHFRLKTHWSLLPLAPLQKYGWGASIGLWLAAIVSVRVVRQYSMTAATTLSLIVFAYVVYSWVWPPLLKKFILKD